MVQPMEGSIYRVILVGDASVGKTTLMKGFCGEEFCPESQTTIGIDFMAKSVTTR